MFGIGVQEMIIILIVALIFFGPKRLPDLAKSIGKGIAEFRKASEEVKKGIDDAMKEEAAPEETPPPKIETARKEQEGAVQTSLPYAEPPKPHDESKGPPSPSSAGQG